MSDSARFSMLIQWSEEDQAYLVTLPEWANRVNTPTTHGHTYEEAAKNGREVLEMLAEGALEEGETLPKPHVYEYAPDLRPAAAGR